MIDKDHELSDRDDLKLFLESLEKENVAEERQHNEVQQWETKDLN